ncbi:MAG TPA: DUF6382 domain-containing protein [Clostridia bacterium]|nr:DUF6382 domain-containing protein [Clostridia bacterium]
MLYEDSGMTFEYSFDSDAASSYLVLKLCNDAKLLNHQMEIICQNPNPAFVPFHIRRENENTCIYYSITSKISLAQYLERKGLNKKELLDLLKSITKSLLLHSNYLLELSSFVIHPDFIYINPATAEVSLLYIPVPCGRNTMEVYRAFLKDLVVNSANVDDNARDNYLQRILNYLKSDSFNLNDFNRLIIDMRNSGGVYDPLVKAAYEHMERTPREKAAASGSIAPKGATARAKNYRRIAGGKSILRVVLLQLLVILAAAIACLFLMSQGKGDMASIAGVLLIAAASDILIMKKISEKLDKGALHEDKDAGAGMNISSSYNTVCKQQRSSHRGRRKEEALTPDILKACDTVMISEVSTDNHPYLESTEAHGGDRVIINKDKFIIGRLGSMVDHLIQGSTVGKLHAEITGSREGYYIRDLNSKNGTYVNGVRIASNKEHEIKDNDRIRFSSYEYIFRLQ